MAKPSPAATATPQTASSSPTIADLKFESALTELEQLVRNMEDGSLPLEESIAAYRRGSELLGHCQQLLKDAEHKIQILENGVLRDFDVAAGERR